MSGRLLTDGDVDYIHNLYPDEGIRRPTGQQELLLAHYFRGASYPAAARAAGYQDPRVGREYLTSPSGQRFLEYLREREFHDIRVTRESVTEMFFSAYKQAATATEMVAAARELGKLHGLYPDQRKQIDVTVTKTTQPALKQLGQMDDSMLLELAGDDMRELLTQMEPIDGEYEQVEDDDV